MVIVTTFERKASTRLFNWLKKAKDDGKASSWMSSNLYEDLVQYWNSDKFKTISEQIKQARGILKSLHTGGAKSVGTITRELKKELGRPPLHDEVFRKYYMRKKMNELDLDQWVEEKAEQTYCEYERQIHELGDSVELTPELSNQIWKEKVAGGSHRGQVYGMGCQNNI